MSKPSSHHLGSCPEHQGGPSTWQVRTGEGVLQGGPSVRVWQGVCSGHTDRLQWTHCSWAGGQLRHGSWLAGDF